MKKRLSNLTMQRKMMLMFAIPVILLCAVILLYGYPRLNKKYEEQIEYSIGQSGRQAVAFIDSYLQSMRYLSEMISVDVDLRTLLKEEAFQAKKPMDEAYRDFYRLNERFIEIELANPLFRVGIYVPDECFYSVNRSHVYPESELEAIDEYELMMDTLRRGEIWATTGTERDKGNVNLEYETLVIYRMVFEEGNMNVPLCVSKVSMELKWPIEVLNNARITEQGITCVVNERDKIVFSSMKGGGQEELDGKWTEYRGEAEMAKVKLQGEPYYIMSQSLTENEWDLLALIPAGEINSQSRMVGTFFIMLGFGVVGIVFISSHLLSKYYVRRLGNLRDKMAELPETDLNAGFDLENHTSSGDEIEDIYFQFNRMTAQLRMLLQEHYRMGKNVTEAELKALQAQINPHFLYNTLDLINWTAMDYGATEIADIALNLAKFYRLSLNHGKNILIIRDELAHVNAYVEIENFHFDQAIHVEESVSEEIMEMACPNIILQPFVENAIVHGIAELPEITECNIWISADEEDGDIIFRVSDDGKGISEEQMKDILPEDIWKSSKGYGVKNINFRLKLYYGEKYGVCYENREGGGTTVYIRIPKLTLEETETRINGYA